MNMHILDEIEIFQVPVTACSVWLFVRITLNTGHVGLGEATLDGRADDIKRELRGLAGQLIGSRACEIRLTGAEDIAKAAVISSLNQALCDSAARARNLSAAGFLGGEERNAVNLYANINRRTTARTPEAFQDSARRAFDSGFRAFKIAPFDEVIARTPIMPNALTNGLKRIEAVRNVIGNDARLMVDCHWRFDKKGAFSLLDACVGYDLHWIECPMPENSETFADIAKLRARAARNGILLAGGEGVVGLSGLRPYLHHGCYDVMMPDVKYVGGPWEMLRVADLLASACVEFSPHNPSGPVSHAASMEVCAAAQNVGLLECQYDETPLFSSLVTGNGDLTANAVLEAGRVGFGIKFWPDVLKRYSLTPYRAKRGDHEKDTHL